MKIEVNGVQYGDFTAANATLRLDALSNTFGFAATSDEAQPLPFRGGEACKVFVDGEQVLAGFIEVVNVSGDSTNHSIDIQGRDKTGDLLDSSIGSLEPLSGRVSLATLCKKVIAHIGASIEVVDEVNPKSFNAAEDIANPDPGDNAFEFLEKYARKRQVLLTSNAEGNLVITTSSGEFVLGFLQNRIDDVGETNNVLRYEVSYDTTGRFNLYRSISQLNPNALSLAGDISPSVIANQGSTSSDADIRRGRQHVLVSEAMSSSGQSADRAKWEADIRKARGRVYSATVDGYRDQFSDLWRINKLITVLDDDAGIEAKMLINSVNFSLDSQAESGGRTTTLSLLARNAYTLELEEPVEDEVGDELF